MKGSSDIETVDQRPLNRTITPPKPPRKKSTMKIPATSSCDAPESAYQDIDAPTPAVTDDCQSEVKAKPIPRPRSKTKLKAQCNDNTVDSIDTNGNTTNEKSPLLDEHPADHKRPTPVRPPPPPLMSKYINRGNHYMTSTTEPAVKPPAVSTEGKQTRPPSRPERPPLPSIKPLSLRPKSETYTNESQQSRRLTISSTQQSPAPSEEAVSLCGTYGSTATDSTDRPAVPVRPWQSSLPRTASDCTLQTRPPPPPFAPPPPPPSIGTSSEPVYSEIDNLSYLDILPDNEDQMSQGRGSTVRLGHHNSWPSFHQQPIEGTEDIPGMLRWLAKMSKFDSMSLYGLSIEEEISSFHQRAMNVKKALRLYNLLMMKRNESLKNLITEFNSISSSLDKAQKKNKTMGIAGGTTGAVGGVTAVLGIALAPVTMGTSLIATAIGAGMVASAGGMGAHAAKANKKIVNRTTVEKQVFEYKNNIVDVELCLDFILSGMNELRRHDIARLQRAGAQPEALKMAHLSQSVIRNKTNCNRKSSVILTVSSEKLLKDFVVEMDQYFTEKEGQKLKEKNKSKFSGRVRLLADNLQEQLDHLNCMWEMFG